MPFYAVFKATIFKIKQIMPHYALLVCFVCFSRLRRLVLGKHKISVFINM